jgi:hypothetical protein
LPGEGPKALEGYADRVRFHRRLGGVTPLLVPEDAAR